MKKFIAIFRCAEGSKNHQIWLELNSEARAERMKKGELALAAWKAKFKERIQFESASLGGLTKTIDLSGIHEISSQMGGVVCFQAPSFIEAAEMFRDHPHFAFFPGDGVDVLECIEGNRS
jgi:hypothetical protein